MARLLLITFITEHGTAVSSEKEIFEMDTTNVSTVF
jgi:hypothetical protein